MLLILLISRVTPGLLQSHTWTKSFSKSHHDQVWLLLSHTWDYCRVTPGLGVTSVKSHLGLLQSHTWTKSSSKSHHDQVWLLLSHTWDYCRVTPGLGVTSARSLLIYVELLACHSWPSLDLSQLLVADSDLLQERWILQVSWRAC